jgi:hypothetical protein
MGYQGFVEEGVASNHPFLIVDASGVPVNPDAAPTWRLYGVNGLVAAGTGSGSAFESGSVQSTTGNGVDPIVITTTAAHGLSVGQNVTIFGVGGNTAANGTFAVASVPSSTTFTVDETGNGAYTSGGSWQTTGLYKVALSGSVLNSLEAGKTYTLVVNWLLSTARRGTTITFTVR